MSAAYTEEEKEVIFERIIEYICNGMALRKILKRKDTFNYRVWQKMISNEDYRIRYARACEERADFIFDDMMRIADTPKKGKEITTKPDGSIETKVGDMLGHRKLQVDTRKWILGKLNPKKYGDSSRLDLSSTDGTMTPNITAADQEQQKRIEEALKKFNGGN
jgi:hypothetical protein